MTLFPRVSMSDLQRKAKEILRDMRDYVVLQRHGRDVGMIVDPEIAQWMFDHNIFEKAKKEIALNKKKKVDQKKSSSKKISMETLDPLIGSVLTELSKR